MATMTKYTEYTTSIEDFFMTGTRWFDIWQGMPNKDQELTAVLQWIKALAKDRNHDSLKIAELLPGGGKWTHTLLQELLDKGLPKQLIYDVVGTDQEQLLTLRDAIKLIDKSIGYGKPTRTRAYRFPTPYFAWDRHQDPALISELLFRARKFNALTDYDVYDMIFCFQPFTIFNPLTQEETLTNIRDSLKKNGVLIINIHKEYKLQKIHQLESLSLSIISSVELENNVYFYAYNQKKN